MDKKILLGLSVLVIIGILGVAQFGNADLVTGMIGYKSAGMHKSSFVLCFVVVKLVALAVVTFIVSAIFWWTHKLIIKPKK